MKQILQDILKILSRDEKRKLWKLSIADVFISILDIVFLMALLFVIRFYTQPDSLAPGNFSLPAVFRDHRLSLILVFFLLFTLKNMLGFMISKGQYHFVYGVASRISRDGLRKHLNGNFRDYVNIDSSVFHRKINQQPIEFCHYVLYGMQQVFSQIFLVSITCIAIIIFNPLLFPLLIILLAPPVLLISFFMKRRLQASSQHGKKTSEMAIQHLQEALAGFVESNTYLKNDFFTNRYHRYQSKLNRYLSERLVIQSMPPRLIEVFAVFGLLILVLVNSLTTSGHAIPLITIGALMIAAYKIIPGIVKISNTAGQVKSYAYTTSGLANTEEPPFINKQEDDPIESVELENIYFNYKGKSVLDAFSLQMNKGEMVGLEGISGRGKTTLINLLLGFLDPVAGVIWINGKQANQKIRKSYWNRIAYIKQEHFFLHASILENITLDEKTYDREKLQDILSLTGLVPLIKSLPQGLNAMITENGRNFSGGQRQRFAFARALYKDFDLLILDEPFNELDESSEMDMLNQLQKIADQGKIVLLITHHMTSISYCKRKISMDERV